MRRSVRKALIAGLMLGLVVAAAARGRAAASDEKVDGYAEWHVDGCVIADAQRVCPAPGARFKGEGDARDVASIPLGYELKAKGARQADGSLLASEIEAKPNNPALFEGEIRAATDDMEERARKAGRFLEGDPRKPVNLGRLYESGPQVERVRGIVDSLLPPYLHPEDVRVYVIENKEWNAFAMGNYSIYVFSGLLNDMDDDEVAIVLGHELVHATHEHSRKQMKREMWVQLAALGALAATSKIGDDTKRAIAQLVTGLAATAYSSGYGRGMEDQADRVGLRYAYEAGYDITKGPRLWNRFARKYGQGNKVVNFFFSDHSQSAARATKLEKEIAFNYPDGPKPDGPPRRASGPEAAPAGTSATVSPAAAPGAARALTSPAPTATGGTERTEIKPGMTQDEVRRSLGAPDAEVVFGDKSRWTYPDLTILFEKGRVTEVRF
jgi:Zn-dependent protease with chaperone function